MICDLGMKLDFHSTVSASAMSLTYIFSVYYRMDIAPSQVPGQQLHPNQKLKTTTISALWLFVPWVPTDRQTRRRTDRHTDWQSDRRTDRPSADASAKLSDMCCLSTTFSLQVGLLLALLHRFLHCFLHCCLR